MNPRRRAHDFTEELRLIEPQLPNDSATTPGAWHPEAQNRLWRRHFCDVGRRALGLERRATTRGLGDFYLTATRSADWTYVDRLGAPIEFWMENG